MRAQVAGLPLYNARRSILSAMLGLLGLLYAPIVTYAQSTSVTGLEYFFNEDPGIGNGIPLPIESTGDTVAATTGIDTAGLPPGQHVLAVRARGVDGEWGLVASRPIFVSPRREAPETEPSVVAVEFALDSSAFESTRELVGDSLTVAALGVAWPTTGRYMLRARAVDAKGRRGLETLRPVYVMPALPNDVQPTALWVQPVIGGTALGDDVALRPDGSIDLSILASELAQGRDTISFRAVDSNGLRGTLATREVFRLPQPADDAGNQVQRVEYYFDDEPGRGRGSTLYAEAPVESVVVEASLDVAAIDDRVRNTVFVRARAESGAWGFPRSSIFRYVKPKIAGFSPKESAAGATVSIAVLGEGFLVGTNIELVAQGSMEPIAEAMNEIVSNDATRILATFDLRDVPVGDYLIQARFPDARTALASDLFVVSEAARPEISIAVDGFRFFRPGRPFNISVSVQNTGVTDAFAVRFATVFEGIESVEDVALQTTLGELPGSPVADSLASENPVFSNSGEGFAEVFVPLFIPYLPVGQSATFEYEIETFNNFTIQNYIVTEGVASIPEFVLDKAIVGCPEIVLADPCADAWLEASATMMREIASFIPVADCAIDVFDYSCGLTSLALAAFNLSPGPSVNNPFDFETRFQEGGAFSDVLVTFDLWTKMWQFAGSAVDGVPCASVFRQLAKGVKGVKAAFTATWKQSLKKPSGLVEGVNVFNKWALGPIASVGKVIQSTGVTSREGERGPCSPPAPSPSVRFVGVTGSDPNEKVGPGFQGEAVSYVRIEDRIDYRIFFENLSDATAPAQEVFILDAIDSTIFDLDSIEFGEVEFGGRFSYEPLPRSRELVADIDMRPSTELIVRVRGELIRSTGTLRWWFESIDPNTNQLTRDPFDGFLPPNINAPEGEGSVRFSIRLLPDAEPEAVAANSASIVFDFNDPIVTNTWSNQVDTSPPMSRVEEATVVGRAGSDSVAIDVRWGGADDTSADLSYTVFVEEEDGGVSPWLLGSSATQDVFVGEQATTYGFFSIATDAAGRTEAPKLVVEAVVETPVSIGEADPDHLTENRIPPVQSLMEGISPNPFNPSTVISYGVSEGSHVEISVFDARGRHVSRVVSEQQRSGWYSVAWSPEGLASGVYFVALRVDGRFVETRKIALLK